MTKKTADDTYEAIKEQILAGALRPAERLVEANLADSLQVSRYNVRTALDRLQSDGLVTIEVNKGATVRSLTLEEVLDMYVAREGLEVAVVRLAAERITAAELDELQLCLQAMKEAFEANQFEAYSNLNKQFHQIIYQASGNQTLPEFIAQIRLRLARLNIRVILLPNRGNNSLREHTAIYEALAERDRVQAAEAIQQHIQGVRADVAQGWHIVRF